MKKVISFLKGLFENKDVEEEVVVTVEKKLTDSEFSKIAAEFDIEEAALKAIFKVECGGRGGFLTDDPDIPVTLEEGHIFYKYGKQKGLDVDSLCKEYPTICYPKWTKSFYKSGKAEYERYLLAKSVNEECAMLATSWGLGQLMGFNYKACGYSTVKDFVDAMYVSETNQLRAVCSFIKANKTMYTNLKNLNWAGFAKAYNGPGYAQNKYDEKLEKAYNSYKTS